MGYKAAVQILKEIEDVKANVLKKSDLLVDTQAWTEQQKLQSVCQQALLLDLEYALDKKVEQDLWNIGFKSYIASLQDLARDKKNSRRAESQTLLTWCLEAASGFYLTLLHDLCNAFDIDLPFRRRGNIYGQTNPIIADFTAPRSSSCLYICQYCLVHLGDIARYRNQRKQAEIFYKQAILVSPNSGQPYNQLALLEASQGDKLSTVFYYIRSIAVKNPFPASTTNLLNTLNSTVDKDNPLEKIQRKITVNEFVQIFLSTHAFLHSATDLPQAEIGVQSLNSTMTALVATQSFTTERLIQITAINLYALKHVSGASIDDLTEDEKVVRHLILDLLAGSLSAFLVPVHTLKTDETILDYYALPAVKLLMYWIQSEPEILQSSVFENRLQIWPSLCKLLNNVRQYLKEIDGKSYESYPLSEDRSLQGFRPLVKIFKEFNFKSPSIENNNRTEKVIRMKRITDFGKFITNLDVNNTKLMILKARTESEDDEVEVFEPCCTQPDPTNDLLEEMKSINIMDVLPIVIKKNTEKRGGILKPQGSLEKSREEREFFTSESNLPPEMDNAAPTSTFAKKDTVKNKRSKQNVALQSIFKKLEENKQVKFNVDEISKDKEKILSFETKPSASTSQFTPAQLRTQSFNKNHPAFPNPHDYINSLRNMNMNKPPPNPNPGPGNFAFSKPAVPVDSSSSMLPYPNFNNKPPPPNSFNPAVHGRSYHNAPFPPHNQNSNSWWPSNTSQGFQRPDDYSMNYAYGGNMPYMSNQPDFNKGNPNQPGGDMFNSPWSNFGRSNFMGGEQNGPGPMRPGMENLAMHPPPRSAAVTGNDNFLPNTQQGYSLFNANTWSPSLVGQLRGSKPQESPITHLPQQSLFSASTGPKSLAQLLEQQQLQKTDQ